MIARREWIRTASDDLREWASLFSGKYFAMIVIYADETGTQGFKKGGKEPAPGVYGFIDTPENWDSFRAKWASALKTYNAPYFHFRELNPTERQKPGNPFLGWDNDKVDDFIHDMAVVASCGPVPLGGYVSIRNLYGGRTDKQAHLGSYETAFEQFFEDVGIRLAEHFPGNDKVTFFFDENENEEWIEICNKRIKKAREKNPRIGEFSFIDSTTERGMPCQAADLFAFVNRQHTETVFEKDKAQPTRLLDFIISRHAYPKNHPRSRYARYSDNEWKRLIDSIHADKRLRDAGDIGAGREKRPYYPFAHHPTLKIHMKQMMQEPNFFPIFEDEN